MNKSKIENSESKIQMKFWIRFLFALISGFSCGVAYYPSYFFNRFLGIDVNLGWISFIAPIFFIISIIYSRRIWSAIFLSMVFGYTYYINVMTWIAGVTPLGLFATGVIYILTFWVLLGAMIYLFSKYLRTFAPPMIAAGWVGYEFLLSWFWGRTPWAFMGYNAFGDFPLIQFADVFGIWGVSFVMILLSATIACSIRAFSIYGTVKLDESRLQAKKWRKVFIISVSIFVLAHIYGGFRPWTLAESEGGTVTIALSQPSIPQGMRNARSSKKNSLSVIDQRQIDIFKALSETPNKTGEWEYKSKALDGTLPDTATTDVVTIIRKTDKPIQLVVDSETSFNYQLETFVKEGRKYYRFDEVAEYVKIPKEVGWFMQISAAEKPLNQIPNAPKDLATGRNCSHLYSPNGEILQTYQKVELVPFGESVPFFNYTKLVYYVLHHAIGRAQQFEPGEKFEVFEIPSHGQNENPVKYGVVICFETNFPYVNREIVKKGAEFIVVHSNDGWFLDTYEPEQIWLQTQVRAIENRVGYVRAVNSGISGVCDQTGKIIAVMEKDGKTRGVAGALVIDAPKGCGRSLYHFFGDILAHICTLLSLAMLVILSIFAIFKQK